MGITGVQLHPRIQGSKFFQDEKKGQSRSAATSQTIPKRRSHPAASLRRGASDSEPLDSDSDSDSRGGIWWLRRSKPHSGRFRENLPSDRWQLRAGKSPYPSKPSHGHFSYRAPGKASPSFPSPSSSHPPHPHGPRTEGINHIPANPSHSTFCAFTLIPFQGRSHSFCPVDLLIQEKK